MSIIIQKKRMINEEKLLKTDPLHYTTAFPDKENPLIWYCIIIGQKGTPYYGGHYIYKVVHSPLYPAEPPDYYFLTPSGRYDIEKKICLSNSSYHKGEWKSTWNIKSILIAFYSVFLDDKERGISHIVPDGTRTITSLNQERKILASTSIEYNKTHLASIYNNFDFTHLADDVPTTPASVASVASVAPVVPVAPVAPVVPVAPVILAPVVDELRVATATMADTPTIAVAPVKKTVRVKKTKKTVDTSIDDK
jgi:ubiquitin-protein ligase